MKNLTAKLIGGFVLLTGLAYAGPGKEIVIEPETPKTFCDHYGDVLGLAKLYEGDGPLIQEIKLIGRYHGQYHNTESDLGDDSDWENRRFRFGVGATFLENFEFEGQFNLKNDFSESGRLFETVEDLTISWEPNDAWGITVGKQKPKVTREYSTSSKRIKTIERSQLVNQIVPDKAGGIVLTLNDVAGFEIDLGGFTGDAGDDWDLPDFDGGYGLYARIGREITEATEVRFDYFYNDGDPNNGEFEDFGNIFSLNSSSDWDRMHLVTDLIYATGINGEADNFGVVFMPYYDITDKLEAVFRYTYSNSDRFNGLDEQSRYEDDASGAITGDAYNAFYLGLNYYICGDKLKLMNGVEYADMSGGAVENDWWTFFTGVRMYF
tara:strand:+ start:15599 stop:16735 length:1137 start_codon:yes stop_codon:yes gene_type:complete